MDKKLLKGTLVAGAALAAVSPQVVHAEDQQPEGELVASFIVTVSPSIDGQTLNEAEQVANSFLNNYRATNESTPNDIYSALSLVINSNKYTVSIPESNGSDGNYEWTSEAMQKATDTARGRLNFSTVITEKSTGNTKTIIYNQPISRIEQSIQTVKEQLDRTLSSYNYTNSTTADDLINLVRVTNEDITLSWSQEFEKTEATEGSRGTVTGQIAITDGTTTLYSDVIGTIGYQNQSVTTVYNEYNTKLDKYPFNIGTTADMLKDLVTVTNPDIHVSVENFRIYEPSPHYNGVLQCLIRITDSNTREEKTITVDKEITDLPATLVSNINKVQDFINRTTVTNATKPDELLSEMANDVIDRDAVTLNWSTENLELPNKTEATESSEGKLTGILKISDGPITVDIPVNKTIKRLSATVDGTYDRITDLFNSYVATSGTSRSTIESMLNNIIDDDYNDNNVKVTLVDYNKVDSSVSTEGSIAVEVNISDDNNSRTLNKVFKLNALDHTSDNLRAAIEQYFRDTEMANEVTEDSLEQALRAYLGLSEDDYLTVIIKDRKRSTGTNDGYIKGEVSTGSGNDNIKVNFDKVISKISHTEQEDKDNADKALDEIKKDFEDGKHLPTGDGTTTKPEDIIKYITNLIDDPNILVRWNPAPIYIPPTIESEGHISGVLEAVNIEQDKVIWTTPIDMTIPRLVTVPEDIEVVIPTVPGVGKPSNGTTADTIKKQLEEALKNKVKNVRIENFKKIPATKYKEGSISYDIIYTTLDDVEHTYHVEKVIPKLHSGSGSHSSSGSSSGSHSSSIGGGGHSSGDIGGSSRDDDSDDDDDDSDDDNNSNRHHSSSSTDLNDSTDIGGGSAADALNNANNGGHSGSSGTTVGAYDKATIDKMMADDYLTSDKHVARTATENSELSMEIRTDTIDRDVDFKNDEGIPPIEQEITGIDDKTLDLGESYDWEENDNNAGNLKFIRNDNNEIIGVLLNIDNPFAIPTLIKLETSDVNFNTVQNIYTYNNEMKKFSPINVGKSVTNNSIIFQTNGSSRYLILGNETKGIDIAVSGWVKDGNSRSYITADGTKYTNDWKLIEGKWYLFDASGHTKTGWAQSNGKWYYLDDSGAMVTGWKNLQGTWYYMDGSGAMVTGWQQVNGKWYYMNQSGAMMTGWQRISGKWYFLNVSGDMATGWIQSNGNWYYLNKSGVMLTNCWIGNYKLDATGKWVE